MPAGRLQVWGENTEHGKGAGLSKQPVSFGAWQVLVLSGRIELLC